MIATVRCRLRGISFCRISIEAVVVVVVVVVTVVVVPR